VVGRAYARPWLGEGVDRRYASTEQETGRADERGWAPLSSMRPGFLGLGFAGSRDRRTAPDLGGRRRPRATEC
jgi:hypothetical protein